MENLIVVQLIKANDQKPEILCTTNSEDSAQKFAKDYIKERTNSKITCNEWNRFMSQIRTICRNRNWTVDSDAYPVLIHNYIDQKYGIQEIEKAYFQYEVFPNYEIEYLSVPYYEE